MGEGILYVCGTPIGNLEDISFRVIRILKEVDLIAAEDTRHSIKLLNHFEIKTSLTSYHEHNEVTKGKALINLLKEGKNIALISDAGMPGISDPGERIIKLCYENNIKVTCVPGPTAVITALVISGLPTRRYVFEGFLPTEKKERLKILENLKFEQRTIVIYESPHHLLKTIEELYKILKNRKVALVRELTKQFEEVIKGDFIYFLNYFRETEPRGEFVIIIEGESEENILKEERAKWEGISISEHMEIYLSQNFDRKEAMKKVAKDRGVSKREIYSKIHLKQQEK